MLLLQSTTRSQTPTFVIRSQALAGHYSSASIPLTCSSCPILPPSRAITTARRSVVTALPHLAVSADYAIHPTILPLNFQGASFLVEFLAWPVPDAECQSRIGSAFFLLPPPVCSFSVGICVFFLPCHTSLSKLLSILHFTWCPRSNCLVYYCTVYCTCVFCFLQLLLRRHISTEDPEIPDPGYFHFCKSTPSAAFVQVDTSPNLPTYVQAYLHTYPLIIPPFQLPHCYCTRPKLTRPAQALVIF